MKLVKNKTLKKDLSKRRHDSNDSPLRFPTNIHWIDTHERRIDWLYFENYQICQQYLTAKLLYAIAKLKRKQKGKEYIHLDEHKAVKDALELWDSFSERISTIYLPNRKRPMLPTILSDTICSLQEGHDRFAFTLDLLFDKNTYLLKNYTLKNTCINVVKNYRYETPELLVNKSYKLLFTFVRNINSIKMYVDNINTSHDVIAYLMIYMNYICSKKMADYKIGIFRSAELKEDFKCPGHISPNIGKFLKNWNSYGGKYTKYKNQKSHEILKLESYIHITSPIRRLVDLLNIIVLQNSLGLMKYSEKSKNFYDMWVSDEKIEYINKTMRSIRKVQNKCELLKICVKENADMKKIYSGFIFDKLEINDGLYHYMVYLPSIKMVNRFASRHDKENLTNQKFKLFIFTDETSFKKKIRVEMIN